jgi:vancomycin permeability regulator SanA
VRRPHLPRRRLLAGLLAAGVLVVGILAATVPSFYVRHATAGLRYGVADVPRTPVAIVLGAGINGDAPSPFLQQRLDLAVELFRAGRVSGLLMSGDHGRADHDEVAVMTAYAVAHGVPAAVIGQDHAGFDTYDSCYRAKAIFGVRRAIVVTQDFHLPRAVYLCRRLGIEAYGVGIDSAVTHPADTRKYAARERLSTAKALWQALVTHPEPHFLGPHETQLDAVIAAG